MEQRIQVVVQEIGKEEEHLVHLQVVGHVVIKDCVQTIELSVIVPVRTKVMEQFVIQGSVVDVVHLLSQERVQMLGQVQLVQEVVSSKV
jgi:hypothetical protein